MPPARSLSVRDALLSALPDGGRAAWDAPPSLSLTAASSPVMPPTAPAMLTPEAMKARTQGWQRRIIELASLVPEVAGAASLVRGSVSRVEWVVEGGTTQARARLQAQIDGFDAERAAELIWLSGECYVGVPDGALPLYSLSVTEVFLQDPSKREVMGATGKRPLFDETVRLWRPALDNRWHATSPNRAAMDVIEAMYLHQLADSAVATSRLAGAGILIWPTGLPDIPLLDDGTPAPGSRQALIKEFHDAAWQSIKNREGKDAHIPFVVFVDPQDQDYKPELLRIDRDDHADQYKARFESYRLRYATAIDLPIEQVTGVGSTNHWSSWAIREDQWRSYLAPLVDLIRDGLERRLARPYGMRIVVDPTGIIAKPDPTATMLRLLQLGVIDPAYAFEQMSLDPSKAQVAPDRAYSTQQMSDVPAEFKVGGERGGASGAQPQ